MYTEFEIARTKSFFWTTNWKKWRHNFSMCERENLNIEALKNVSS